MSRIPSMALIGSLVVVIGACADRNAPTAPAPTLQLDLVSGSRSPAGVDRPRGAGSSLSAVAGVANGIGYHGGTVLVGGPGVAAIYWGSSVIYAGGPEPGSHGLASRDQSLIGYFLRHLSGTPYFGVTSTYTDGSGTRIANSVRYRQYWSNNQFHVPGNDALVSPSEIEAVLQYGLERGFLSYDPATIYAVFSAGRVNLGGGFGTEYCAYHAHAQLQIGGVTRRVIYAVMPYAAAYPYVCTVGMNAPNADPGADAEVNLLAHEIEEATTDPFFSGWWNGTTGEENADMCAWSFGSPYLSANGSLANLRLDGKDFLVQQLWVNASGGLCAMRP